MGRMARPMPPEPLPMRTSCGKPTRGDSNRTRFWRSTIPMPSSKETGGLLKTGPTHTNVMDLQVILIAQP